MVNTLAASIRNYKWPTIATPILVLFEVACEMAIPFVTANLIDVIKDGATVAEILPTAGVLVVIALISLLFGAAAGITCSYASCGFAKNLRHDLFYKIQTFSFANIEMCIRDSRTGSPLFRKWRRRRDSNPRTGSTRKRFSRPPHSTLSLIHI